MNTILWQVKMNEDYIFSCHMNGNKICTRQLQNYKRLSAFFSCFNLIEFRVSVIVVKWIVIMRNQTHWLSEIFNMHQILRIMAMPLLEHMILKWLCDILLHNMSRNINAVLVWIKIILVSGCDFITFLMLEGRYLWCTASSGCDVIAFVMLKGRYSWCTANSGCDVIAFFYAERHIFVMHCQLWVWLHCLFNAERHIFVMHCQLWMWLHYPFNA